MKGREGKRRDGMGKPLCVEGQREKKGREERAWREEQKGEGKEDNRKLSIGRELEEWKGRARVKKKKTEERKE